MPTTGAEQLLLELVNEARLDPLGNAARYVSGTAPLTSGRPDIQSALTYFDVSGAALKTQLAALIPVQPVAFSEALADAARDHDAAMIAADTQSHQVAGEAGLGARAAAKGYAYRALGENVYAYANDPLYAHAGFMIDWGTGTGGMQNPAGHRIAIMNAAYREVGIAILDEANAATRVGPQVVTQDFGTRGESGALVLGVAYADRDGDAFYTVGEGTAGLRVALGAGAAVSSASGGYTLETAATGRQSLVLTGGGLSGPVTVTTTLSASGNLKLDVVDGSLLRISGSATILGPVATIQGLGLTGLTLAAGDAGHTLVGTPGNDTLSAGAGADTLRGLAGNDTLGAGFGTNVIDGGTGDDTAVFEVALAAVRVSHRGGSAIVSGAGFTTTLTGIEHVRFTDGTVESLADTPRPDGGLVDAAFYLAANPDVARAGLDPAFHYAEYGWKEGRDPNAMFSTVGYLAANPDVRAAGIDPLGHYDSYGWREGRDPGPGFDTGLYLLHNPAVRAAGIDPLRHYLESGQAEGREAHAAIGPWQSFTHGSFDAAFYLLANADVARAGIDPFAHYSQYGWREGRDPNAAFDVEGYLNAYGDVRAAGIDPLQHYDRYGWHEGRDPSADFDTNLYLAANADVRASGIDPLQHYLQFGAAEGRSAAGDGGFHLG